MSCDKYFDLIPLYLLEELGNESKKELDTHLANCQACQIELEELSLTINKLDNVYSKELSELEKLRLQNSVYKSILLRSINVKQTRTKIFKFTTRTVAALIIFVAGYYMSSAISENSIDNTNRHMTKLSNYTMLYESKIDISGYRFTSNGLKIIAKGKNAVLEPK